MLTFLGWGRVTPPISKPPLRTVTVTRPQAVVSASKRGLVPAICVRGIQPLCVQALYNLPTAPATAQNNSIAVSGFLGEVANQTDLTVRRVISGPSPMARTPH